jgi:hypothetical protein
MTRNICVLVIGGFLALAGRAYPQYTMELTSLGSSKVVADGEFVGPYEGSIWSGAYTGTAPVGPDVYSGYIICDDMLDPTNPFTYWNATATDAGDLDGTELFTGGYKDTNASSIWDGTSLDAQQAYDAVAWLANQMILPANATNATAQTNYQFAIWDIMGGMTTDPDGGATGLIDQALTEVLDDGYVGTNVAVFSPSPGQPVGQNVAQEFLVVNTPEASTSVLLGADGLGFLGLFWLLRRRVLRRA